MNDFCDVSNRWRSWTDHGEHAHRLREPTLGGYVSECSSPLPRLAARKWSSQINTLHGKLTF